VANEPQTQEGWFNLAEELGWFASGFGCIPKETDMALCPRCIKVGKQIAMRIDGIKFVCPECTFRSDFPKKELTLPEALKRIAELEAELDMN